MFSAIDAINYISASEHLAIKAAGLHEGIARGLLNTGTN